MLWKSKLKGLNINYVINLGGYINHSNIKKTKESHFYGCVNLINYFKYKKISNFIQVGSSLEYGPISTPHSEKNFNCYPIGNYGLSKLKATEFLKKKREKLQITIYYIKTLSNLWSLSDSRSINTYGNK